MVPQTARNTDRLPAQDSDGTRHSITGKYSSRNWLLEYLRRRFRNKSISEVVTQLLLASWRQDSAQSYNSTFQKWVCWCDQRNSDPVSGPINKVINFLACIFKEGYQYRSPNHTTQQYCQSTKESMVTKLGSIC